jgi:hypothetical protein
MKNALLVSSVALAVVLSALRADHVHAQAAPAPTAQPQPAPGAAPPPAGGVPPAGLTAQPAPAPVAGQPPPVYAPPPVYGQPVYGQPVYGQPVYGQPGYPVTYAQPQRRAPRARKGLMIGGIAAIGASYLIGVITGAVLVSISESACTNCNNVGNLLFIPFAGPFLGMAHTRHADAPLAILGVFQLAGAGLLAGGIVQYTMSKRRAEQEMYSLELRGGRRLSFDVHTSPLRLGPSMQLRF